MAEVPTVLVIDDDQDMLLLLERALRPKGYQVLVSDSAREGIMLARTHQPRLILMDIAMPDMDGIAATRALRSDPETASIPIVALTARASVATRQEALLAGCDEFLVKPCSIRTLWSVVEKYIPLAGDESA